MNSRDTEYEDPREDILDNVEEELDIEEALPPRVSRRKLFAKEIFALVLIGFLVVTFRSVFFEPFKIPTGSMIPTLKIGDLILVNKFAYGFKLPFSDFTMGDINLDPIYLFGEEPVKRGDVVVFKYPKDPSINYIKRVIGLPGETIEIKNKTVFINDEPLTLTKVPQKTFMESMDEKFRDNNFSFYKVILSGSEFVYQVDDDNFFKTNYGKRKIPPGHYFVMGDNRDFSYDSRYWGVVPHSYIKGKAFVVWLSLHLSSNKDEGLVFRTERIGHLIQ